MLDAFGCGVSLRVFGVRQMESMKFWMWWSLMGLSVLRLVSDI